VGTPGGPGSPPPRLPGVTGAVTSRADDGATVTASAHGGHVVSWTTADGLERLWLSPGTASGPDVAIRGGVPVIFPQFAARGDGPRHGIVRTSTWQVRESGPGQLTATWSTDAASQARWPHDARLTLTATASGPRLTLRLDVEATGSAASGAFEFAAALHTYLRVSDVAAVAVTGLGGCAAEDAARGGMPLILPSGHLRISGPTDLVVTGVPGPVLVHDPVLGLLWLSADGFSDRVVWHPGHEHGLVDVPAGSEAGFLCVEAAALGPRRLAPGESWSGSETLLAGEPES
jgi:glucose-6-phosphate 1-epimerase